MEQIVSSPAQNSPTKGISVVIPNYNGRNLLEKNIPFLLAALNNTSLPHEIIIPDDASTDDSVLFVAEKYPDIILVKGGENKGFSGNINRGITVAKLDLILLLNSDIKLSADYFKTQLKYFDNADTFGVMGQIRDETTNEVVEACKYPRSSAFKINHIKNIDFNANGAQVPSFYLSGANALVNRLKLVELGGFNEIFSPFYHEDLDLSLRAWERGWRCYYEHNAVCWHAVSATIKAHSTKKVIKVISTRNRLLLHFFHLSGIRLYLWSVMAFLSLGVRWLGGKLYYYKAYKLYIKKLPVMRTYKQAFINSATTKKQYIPFIKVKEDIITTLNNLQKNT